MSSASSLTAAPRWPPPAGGGRNKRAAAAGAEALRIGDGVVWISEFGEGDELEQNKKSRTSGGTEWGSWTVDGYEMRGEFEKGHQDGGERFDRSWSTASERFD
jgi:hypothetical protein